ncbi:ABC transporter ATP-binding protein [Mesorhizobium sp. CGMCC 1.15528]|uniref:ABC transporter ATP-binding protein n=1 Tax=Mesorhizobium zhangyense TaxID=1776730 RepID=A0A7C9R7T1_9HYPH|nr:ABC transporter ATP-binding protein [Mesorhizobium zhangyense]NGN41638.1 ABC transporter ATP-binding protein [Mesorhizobium zhangyense]
MPGEVVLETNGLTVRFGGVTAVDRVDFALRERELRCLIGPNGAGKSTFFKCLTGMLQPSDGQVYLRGEPVSGLGPHRLARLGVGIKTQVPSVMNGLSVHENVWLAARRRSGDANAGTLQALEAVGIADLRRELVGQLSHGQRQLVELAIVLAAKPWLILLDEPAAGLSGEEVERMVGILRGLVEHATLIVVEHDMHFIRQIAETVTVFHQGRVIAQAPVEDVLEDPLVRDVYLGRSL